MFPPRRLDEGGDPPHAPLRRAGGLRHLSGPGGGRRRPALQDGDVRAGFAPKPSRFFGRRPPGLPGEAARPGSGQDPFPHDRKIEFHRPQVAEEGTKKKWISNRKSAKFPISPSRGSFFMTSRPS